MGESELFAMGPGRASFDITPSIEVQRDDYLGYYALQGNIPRNTPYRGAWDIYAYGDVHAILEETIQRGMSGGYSFQAKIKTPGMPISNTFKYFRNLYNRLKYEKQIEQYAQRPRADEFDLPEEKELRLANDYIRSLRESALSLQELGAEVIFYLHPYNYHEKYREVGKIGRALLVEELGAYNTADVLKNEHAREPLFMDIVHLTEAGHILYAQYFLDLIEQYL